MPKLLFYAGTACCFFVAVVSAAMIVADVPSVARVWWGIAIALLAVLSIASLFLRMAALLAARNLFEALMAVLFVAAAMASLAGVLLLEWRIAEPRLAEGRGAGVLGLGFFVAVARLSFPP